MTPTTSAPAQKPSHVPDGLVADVDFFNLPGAEDDVQAAWLRVKQENAPIFWTPRNGGHWIVTRSEDLKALQMDHERFSHREIILPKIKFPEPLVPIMLDPPEHTGYRRLIMKLFAPARLDLLEARAQELSNSLVEGVFPKGECEFVSELSEALPIVVFLEMMGLPTEDWRYLKTFVGAVAHSQDESERQASDAKMTAYVEQWVDKRLAAPGDDPISYIGQAEVDGQKLSRRQTINVVRLLLGGGLDTVANMMAFQIQFLARHPEHRRQLAEDPGLIPNAVEELIRRHGLSATCREVTHDMTFGEVFLAKGDLIQQPNCLFGLDDALNPNPLEVDFHRPRPIAHAAFGNGPHVCPGSMLARRELKVFLQAWLAKIPEFSIKPGTRPIQHGGMINSITDLYLTWETA